MVAVGCRVDGRVETGQVDFHLKRLNSEIEKPKASRIMSKVSIVCTA
ncbi:predicted protein [Sclerotinia sclerotiorum 1980 UF-70]|uniref:Uncharacterized protein n=1 Tax=Sclerotinia sclerotiorum (strain ATCC 18683 / 1980 / Ss-1) TaxID=665079 RepID=A7EI99_SCLS1|nr:predicted protein [Sclerotinia sclerotiorum 1980 UF-70]EDO02565.1 predicted protein [Sclerotinia sclerotiorum 1980 UF-70]